MIFAPSSGDLVEILKRFLVRKSFNVEVWQINLTDASVDPKLSESSTSGFTSRGIEIIRVREITVLREGSGSDSGY